MRPSGHSELGRIACGQNGTASALQQPSQDCKVCRGRVQSHTFTGCLKFSTNNQPFIENIGLSSNEHDWPYYGHHALDIFFLVESMKYALLDIVVV